MKTLSVLVVIGIAGSVATATGQFDTGALFVADDATRSQAMEATLESRQRLISTALQVLRETDPKRHEDLRVARDAIRLLGEFRASESVEVLVDRIDLLLYWSDEEAGASKAEEAILWSQGYGAAGALIKIGKPAVPACIRRISQAEDPLVRKLCARVILEIEGSRIGKLVVGDALAEAATEQQRQRLTEALKFFK